MLTVKEYKIKVESTCILKFVIKYTVYHMTLIVSKTIAVNFHIIVK